MSQKNIHSDSILKKRIRKFKSLKRGYYSFIVLVSLYIISFFSPILVNSEALIVCYANKKYDEGETYIDANNNQIWDVNEAFTDEHNYYFPAFNDLFGGLFTTRYYEAKFFGQDSLGGKVRYGKPHYRSLQQTFQFQNNGNYVTMPLYPFNPIEEVLTERDERFTDQNKNGKWDENEPFIDNNKNGE